MRLTLKTIAIEMRFSAQNQFFFFCFCFCFLFFFVGKNLLLNMVIWKKSPIVVSLLFGHLKMSENLEKTKNCRKKSEICQKVNITIPDTIGLHHCILYELLPAIWFRIHQQQLVHLLLNPGTYECIIIIQVTTRITDSSLLIPTTSSSIVIEQFCSLVLWPNMKWYHVYES